MRLVSEKRSLALMLMMASIGLLVAFQVIWINKVFREQKDLLEKEAGQVFRETVFNLQDTMIRRKFHLPAEGHKDSIRTSVKISRANKFSRFEAPEKPVFFDEKDTLRWLSRPDTINKSTVSIYMTEDGRKIEKHFDQQLSMVVLNAQELSGEGPKEFKITLGNDSINMNDLSRSYRLNLQKAGLPFDFSLIKQSNGTTAAESGKNILTPLIPAGFPPLYAYGAVLTAFRPYLWRKMIPQLFFSLFLVSLTTVSFAFIYRSLRQQERLTALKNDFISNVTHELKTPIATVSVAIEALRDFNGLQNPQLTKEYLDISKNELTRLSILVDKVLKMAIFEQKALQLQCETLDFSALISEVLTSMKLQFEQYGAQVALQVDEHADYHLNGDRTHLLSVAYNLIDNALKYGSENPVITLTLKSIGDEIVLSVGDNGIGIAPEHQKRVFERFFRVPSGDVHDVKGHGLGLSYVAEVVQKHGGRIELQSVPDSGSCFTVYLPKNNG